jgi:hypothetical protein
MEILFRELLKETNATPETVAMLARDFSSVALVALLGGSAGKFGDEDHKNLEAAWRATRYQDVLQIIRSKYSDDEWARFVQTCLGPIIREYHETVLRQKS